MHQRPSFQKFIVAIAFAISCSACKHEVVQPETNSNDNYPVEVSRIIQRSCVDGCHNATNYTASGGNLLMDTWEHLFDGGGHGAAVVPYSVSNSPLLYFVADTISADMRMPFQLPALSKEDQTILRNWVAKGAPDKNGNVPFASNADTRQKIYVLHNSCNGVAVIDAEKQVIMRYILVGKNYTAEQGRGIKVSPDGRYVYVSFYSGDYVQKIDTRTDTVVAEINMGHAYWQPMAITPDGNKLAIPDWRNQEVTMIGASNMQTDEKRQGFSQPHGITFGQNPDTLYVTAQNGNMVYKVYPGGTKEISLETGKAPYANPAPNVTAPEPHEIMFSPDHSKYFVSCQKTNEVRVMNAATDQLIKAIPVGTFPQAMAVSKTMPYIFVTCREDATGDQTKGSVYAINYETLVAEKINGRFYQPRGISVDDKNGKLYVISRNIATTGPKPHHGSGSVYCNGNNGFYTILDLNTFKEVNRRTNELTVDPYAADVRFR